MGYNKKQQSYRNERNRPRYLSFIVNMLCGLLLFVVIGGVCGYIVVNQDKKASKSVEEQIKDIRNMTDEDFAALKKKLIGCSVVGDDELITPIQNMPRFPGCEDLDISIQEKKKCAEKKMLEFIYGNIQYPARCHIYGMVIINFTIDKEGNIINPKILRDIGCGLGDEGLRVVKLMPKWIPGKQDGKPINFNFNLPIRFKI